MNKRLLYLIGLIVLLMVFAYSTSNTFSDSTVDMNNNPAPSMLRPLLMVDGTLYTISEKPDQQTAVFPQSEDYKYVNSIVPATELPQKDNEANYLPIGTAFVFCEDGIAVNYPEGSWTLYVSNDSLSVND